MTSEPSSFRPEDVQAIYGWPRCVHTALAGTAQDPCDLHHVLGRGGKHDREVHSSILNCVPLRRMIHNGPLRDAPDQRRVYLRVARQRVMNAVGTGQYTLTDIDRDFMALADAWLAENQFPSP